MSGIHWRVRTGAAVRHFSHGLVVQGRRPGILDLSVCMLTGGGGNSPGPVPEPSRGAQGSDCVQASSTTTLARGLVGGLSLLVPLVAACTSEGIRRDTGIVSWLYWPNLVTIDGRLVAITSVSASSRAPSSSPSGSGQQQKEGEGKGEHGRYELVFKVSVNCFGGEPHRPSPLATTASAARALPSTSIRDALGVEIDMRLLRDKILHALTWYQAEWERGMHRKLVDRIQPTIPWLGRKVRVETAGSHDVLVGRAERLDDTGSLVLAGVERRWARSSDHDDEDQTETLSPGDVELVRVAD